jgi:hypothetical protein
MFGKIVKLMQTLKNVTAYVVVSIWVKTDLNGIKPKIHTAGLNSSA